MYTIYLWKANGIPKYVGSTSLTITKRIQLHYISCKKSVIYKYVREHPNEEFSYVAIDYANTKEEAFEKEEFWTEFYRERYSMLNIFTGPIPDDNTKRKISEATKGNNNPFFGKHHTEESKKKMSEARKGKKKSEEFKKYLSDMFAGKNNPSARKVRIKESNQIFESIKECAEFLNVSRPTISNAIKRKSKVKRKYTIEYI